MLKEGGKRDSEKLTSKVNTNDVAGVQLRKKQLPPTLSTNSSTNDSLYSESINQKITVNATVNVKTSCKELLKTNLNMSMVEKTNEIDVNGNLSCENETSSSL